MPKTEHHVESTMRLFSHFDPMEVIGGLVARYPATSDFTFQYEGGYVNDPDDPGGCTNMGITIGTLKSWRGDSSLDCSDVANLTKLEAQMIYATNYWAPVWGNQLPIGLNTQVYDWGVNSGPSRAITYLQRMVGTTADGIMGPNTLKAVKVMEDDRGLEDMLNEYSDSRQSYYESLSSFSKYGNGWTARNEACLALSIDLMNNTFIDFPIPATGLESRVANLENWVSSFSKTS